MPQTIKPMAPATIRRLMASADKREALDAQGVAEAEARGRQTGLLLISSLPIPLSRGERVALGALRLLVERGVVGPTMWFES